MWRLSSGQHIQGHVVDEVCHDGFEYFCLLVNVYIKHFWLVV